MKAIEKELDALVQRLHKSQRCHICGVKYAEAIHHIIGRSNKMLRYDIVNLLPVCYDCHRKIHDEGLNALHYIPKEQAQYLMQVKNESYKDFLTFEMQMTEDEYLKQCKQTLLKVINAYLN